MLEGYVACPICGSGYLADDEQSVANHVRFHSYMVDGPALEPGADDRVVGAVGDVEVLEGTVEDSRDYRWRLACVSYRSNFDTPEFPTAYDGGDEDREYDGRSYVLRGAGHGIGMLVMRKRSPTWWMPWSVFNDAIGSDLTMDANPRWTVDRIWILPSIRRRGIARRLIHLAAERLGTHPTEFAWLMEFSPDGERLVRSLTTSHFWTLR